MKRLNTKPIKDARHYAALVLQGLVQKPLSDSFFCYGTKDKVIIGIGRSSSLELEGSLSLDDIWSKINSYINTNKGNYIFGFIGFDPANQLKKTIIDYKNKIDLYVPTTVIECHKNGYQVLVGKPNILSLKSRSFNKSINKIKICQLDESNYRDQYANSVTNILKTINLGNLERATLARKIEYHSKFDLTKTFLSDHSSHDISRSFYFSSQHIAFAGQSPELLAEGNTQSFSTHKLSGTQAKDKSKSFFELSSEFKDDKRIIDEHYSSTSTIEESLSMLGKVEVEKFKILDLPTLIHGWSEFKTQPNKSTSISNCLRSIFPFGVNPMKTGLELLSQYEDFCRGPYYGLTGVISPDEEFSFTQVLRSAFIDKDSSYLMAGAAITKYSTPAIELLETCTKLYGVEVFEQHNT